MNPYYELPNLGGNFQQVHADAPERPGRQVDGIVSIGAFRAVNALESAIGRLAQSVTRWRQRRIAIRELQALSDHHLADIGLDRSQIVSTVEEIIETGAQPTWHRARSWHGAGSVPAQGAANDNQSRPLFGGQTAARVALQQR